MMWIVGALYGGYVMANVLKWYLVAVQRLRLLLGHDGRHPRRDGHPRVCSAIRPADFLAAKSPTVVISNPIYFVPVLLVLSLVGCLLGTYLEHAGRRGDPQALLPHDAPLGFLGADPRRGHARRPDASSRTAISAKDTINVAGRHRLATLPHGAADLHRAPHVGLGRRHVAPAGRRPASSSSSIGTTSCRRPMRPDGAGRDREETP